MLTTERANEVLAAAQKDMLATLYAQGHCWADRLDRYMTDREREHVMRVWCGMPGCSSWIDAFHKIRRRGY